MYAASFGTGIDTRFEAEVRIYNFNHFSCANNVLRVLRLKKSTACQDVSEQND